MKSSRVASQVAGPRRTTARITRTGAGGRAAAAVVTGIGPVSAIGSGARPFWHALVDGRSGIGPITVCDVAASPSKIGAQLQGFRLRDFVPDADGIARRAPRMVQIALAAAALALADAELTPPFDDDEIGVVVGTSLGNAGESVAALRDGAEPGRRHPPYRAFTLFHHAAACLVSSTFDLRGPIATITTGCNSGLDAIGHAAALVQAGRCDTVVAVGADAELVPEVLALLNAAGALTTRFNDRPTAASRPFDVDRDGNVIGEGAAAVVVESEQRAVARGARIYARIAGCCSTAAGRRRRYDAQQPTVEPDAAIRSLRGALRQAGWASDAVDLVNSNGSSSVVYDRLEARALAATVGVAFPTTPVHSIKSMLGQHGAGSSALQAATACLAIHHGVIPPTTNHVTPDPECGPIRIVTRAEERELERVLVHAIGFGGFYYTAGAFEAHR